MDDPYIYIYICKINLPMYLRESNDKIKIEVRVTSEQTDTASDIPRAKMSAAGAFSHMSFISFRTKTKLNPRSLRSPENLINSTHHLSIQFISGNILFLTIFFFPRRLYTD